MNVDLAERMQRLNATVDKTKGEREKKAIEQREVIRQERVAKWEHLKKEAPDLVESIMVIRSVFPEAKIVHAEVMGKKII